MAKQFNLARIHSILGRTPIIDPENTTVEGEAKLSLDGSAVAVNGELTLKNVNLFHPMLSRSAIRNQSVSGTLALRSDWREGSIVLEELSILYNGVEANLSGQAERLFTGQPKVKVHLKVPKVDCQDALDAFPAALAPDLQGFQLEGTFFADLDLDVDYESIDEASLGGDVGIDGCDVVRAPPQLDAARFAQPFDHLVEAAPGRFLQIRMGSNNPDYLAFGEPSPHAINALMTTEDATFFRHKGFAPDAFSVALARNLKGGGFRLGGSTITMQMVKNVMLKPEKTLSRKLQEMFLTWYVERKLSKNRIMEIYINAVEFGPGIYGLGSAARHYFGKSATEITPAEGAFLATLLPSPRRRYAEYCRGALSKKWKRYVGRILTRMHARGRLFEEEYQEAKQNLDIAFSRDFGAMSTEDCLGMIELLNEEWHEEYLRRLEEAVTKAAPERLSFFMPKDEEQGAPGPNGNESEIVGAN